MTKNRPWIATAGFLCYNESNLEVGDEKMSYLQIGYIIKTRREELGYSQEDLADGICAVATLSRIENGDRMPTKNHYEMLMQRLGYSALSLDYFTDKQDFLIHELKFKIRHAYIEKQLELCRQLLGQLTSLTGQRNAIDAQFISLYDTLLNEKHLSTAERLDRLESAMRLTCPKYGENFAPKVLSYEEIIILNNIALCYRALDQRHRSIELLKIIKNHYDRHTSSAEEALRTQPMILYNLSSDLGMTGQYDECIAVCDEALSLARRTYRFSFYEKTLYNRAWALLHRNNAGDREVARLSLRQSYCFAYSVDDMNMMDILKNFYWENYSEAISV